jgi:hypothetical protein
MPKSPAHSGAGLPPRSSSRGSGAWPEAKYACHRGGSSGSPGARTGGCPGHRWTQGPVAPPPAQMGRPAAHHDGPKERRPEERWLNLQAHPEAVVELAGGIRREVTGRAAVGPERERLWQRWRNLDENLDGYAARRGRETAVVVLEPARWPGQPGLSRAGYAGARSAGAGPRRSGRARRIGRQRA